MSSEFYKLRRSSITDMTGLIMFVIGWFASGVVGWPYIKAGFDAGNPTPGVVRFVVVIFAGAIAFGLVGMILGWIGGVLWQSFHEHQRTITPPKDSAISDVRKPANGAASVAREPLPPLRYDVDAISVDAFLTLAQRALPDEYDARKTASALERTINVAAWDGDRVVGVARILSDGYRFAALADVLVDPDFQRRGLGRELMNRAFEKTPRGALLIGAPLTSSAFFDRIGCERGPTGFTMRRAARTSASG